jgi:hypothetical protein
MRTINEQLGIGIPNRNVNIKSRYTRGLHKYQPQLGTEDWSLDFYNDTQAIGNMSNACGEDTFSNLYGTGQCKDHCKSMFPSDKALEKSCDKTCESRCNRKTKCGTKGDTPFPKRSEVCQKAGLTSTCSGQLGGVDMSGDSFDEQPDIDNESGEGTTVSSGMSTGAKVGIALGVLAILGVGGYLIFRK